jgi:hypothetical protein
MERNKSIEVLIKELNMMGGKIAPKTSDCVYLLNRDVKQLKSAMEADVFRQALETHMDACGSIVRKKDFKPVEDTVKALAFAYISAALCFFIYLLVAV